MLRIPVDAGHARVAARSARRGCGRWPRQPPKPSTVFVTGIAGLTMQCRPFVAAHRARQ